MKHSFAVLFATSAFLATSAWGADPAPAAAAGPSSEKSVTVTLKLVAGKPVGIESVSPDPVELSRGKKEVAHWVLLPADSGKLTITMEDKGGRPFKANPASRGKRDHVYSEAATLGDVGSTHKYTVTVRADGQEKDFVLDPRIIVLP
jgi:hypothetical protein